MTASLILVCDTIGSRHQFGPGGGAFGRSRKCDWVLPDQDRHLSSVHARIVYQNDTFVLIDESTNGTFLEGQSAAIGRGKAVSLSAGMTLLAGPYQIRVESAESSPATSTNPFSGTQGTAANRSTGMATPLRIDTSGASLPQNTSLDPLDHLGGAPETLTPVATVQTPQNVIPEPVAFSAPAGAVSAHETTRFQGGPAASQLANSQPQMPMGTPSVMPSPAQGAAVPPVETSQAISSPVQAAPQTPAAPPPAAAAPAGAAVSPAPAQPTGSGNLIPEDFLAGLGAAPTESQPAPSAPQSSGLPDLSGLMPTPSAGASPPATHGQAPASTIPDNIDFGLGAPAPGSKPATDTSQTMASPVTAAPAPGPVQPPLPASGAAVTSVGAAPATSTPSSGAALNPLDALKKRRAQREAELAQKAKSRADSSLGAKRAGAVPPALKSASPVAPVTPPVVLPNMPAATPVSSPQVSSSTPVQQPAAKQVSTAPTTGVPAGAASPATTPAPGAGNAQISPEIFEALLSGLGFADADVSPEERAEIAKASGEMVRELANGLIALLKARKTLKTEFRMYETRIQPEENNPFKHFNVGELAIDEMLFARKGGFLTPPEATREAFKDLQSHTMLTVAATQRAMRLLFESLAPETLAGEEDDGGLRLRGLGSKRGKFEAAKERHDKLRADFDAVVRQTIAEAFVQVEEEQARQQSKSFWENRKK